MLAALTGSASGGLTIALDALGPSYMALAGQYGIDPGLMHRIAVIGAGTLDILPHNGAVVTCWRFAARATVAAISISPWSESPAPFSL